MNRIAGIAVSDQVYESYGTRKYQVSYGEIPYRTVELYANSEGIAKTDPALAEECKAILAQIRTELQGGKKVKRHPDFTGYLSDLQEIYNECVPKRKALETDYAAKLDECKRSAQAAKTDLDTLRAKTRRAETVEQHDKDAAGLLQDTELKVDAVRTALKAHLSDFYGLNGESIDEPTVKLLNSGIRLSEAEINSLFDRFSGNVTMLRLLSDFCDTNKIKSKNAAILGSRAKSSGKHELDVFNTAADWVRFAVGYAGAVSEKVWSNPELFSKKLNECILELTNVIVKPSHNDVGN